MSKNKILLILSFVFLGFGVFYIAKPYLPGDTPVVADEEHDNCTPEEHNATMTALRAGDYDAWYQLKQTKGIVRHVNRENFAEYAAAKLAEEEAGGGH